MEVSVLRCLFFFFFLLTFLHNFFAEVVDVVALEEFDMHFFSEQDGIAVVTP